VRTGVGRGREFVVPTREARALEQALRSQRRRD